MWIRVLLFMLFCAVVAPATSHAQDDSARTIALIADANKAYDSGDFRSALEGYREAYTIAADPRVLYRIGVTYENLANYQRAREHLELYLLAEPDSKYSGRVKSKIANLRKLEANLQSAVTVDSEPAGAKVWVDTELGRPAGVTPVRLPLGPGRHDLLVRKEGFEDVRASIEIGSGETLSQTFDLGTGSAIGESAAAPVAKANAAPPVPAEVQDPSIGTGIRSRVRIGPSAGVSAISWLCIGVGWALITTFGIIAATQPLGVDTKSVGPGVAVGAGLFALGGYFLWFRDYRKALPNKAEAHLLRVPETRNVGIGLRF